MIIFYFEFVIIGEMETQCRSYYAKHVNVLYKSNPECLSIRCENCRYAIQCRGIVFVKII